MLGGANPRDCRGPQEDTYDKNSRRSHRYGHNMVALGTYEKFKPRCNYYYIYDYMDKYSFKSLTKKYTFLYTEFEETRSKLGLLTDKYVTTGQFFKSEEGRKKFKEIIRETQLPYYEL